MSEKNDDSYEEIDKSQFFDLNREIQSGVREKVISKLLTTVQSQAKEIALLKTENTNLKNHLSYLLKRIILNKYEYVKKPNTNTNQGSSLKMNIIMNNSAIFRDNNLKSNGSMLRPLRSVDKYRCATEGNVIEPTYSAKKNKNVNNEDYIYQQNNSLMDVKVSAYLNNLYKNNFVNNSISNNYSLNKKQSLFDELFKNKKNNSCANYYEDNMLEENLKKNSSQNRTNSYLKNSYNRRLNSKNLRSKKLNTVTYNYMTVKYDPKMTSNKKKTFKQRKIGLNPNKYNIKTYEKVKPKKVVIYPKRSPFLVNKY